MSHDIRLCIASFSFREQFLNDEVDLVSFGERCVKEFGIGDIEVFDPHFADDVAEIGEAYAYGKSVLAKLEKVHARIVAVSAANDLTVDSYDGARAEVHRLRKWIEICAGLRAKVIRINTGSKWGDSSVRPWNFPCAQLRERLGEVLAEAKGNRLVLAIENHPHDVPPGGPGVHYVEAMQETVRLDPSVLGICPDDGHVKWRDPDEWSATMGRLLTNAKHAHAKFGSRAFARPEAPASWADRVELLRECGFRGFVNLEHVGEEDPWQSTGNAVEELRRCL